MVRIFPIARGLASYILPNDLFKRPGSGGTFSSEYCYSVWLRHLVQLKDSGFIKSTGEIKSMAEIGPGDSIGIGLAAMYSGVENYHAFDVIKHVNVVRNLAINNDLLRFFKEGREIPHTNQKLRDVKPSLINYEFPSQILNYDSNYYVEKHKLIEANLQSMGTSASNINYVVPWMGQKQENIKDLDLIISQAVMEHVNDIDFAYSEMFRWLRNGGIISHQIDFKAHEMTKEWDGHFYIKPAVWKILAHGRKYPMNRLPLSSHVESITKAGFKIKKIIPVMNVNNFKNKRIRVPKISFKDEDFKTSSALIQAIKYELSP